MNTCRVSTLVVCLTCTRALELHTRGGLETSCNNKNMKPETTFTCENKMSNEPLRSSSFAGSLGQEQGDAPEENAGCGSSSRLSSTTPRRDRDEWSMRHHQFMPGVEADMLHGQAEASDTVIRRTYTSQRLTGSGFSVFDELRKQTQLCDVTIRVSDKDYPAHRVVLAGTCPYFRGMFTGELSESRQDVVTLKELDPSAVDLLIKFVYSGQVEVTEDNVQTLLPAANLFQLTEVKDYCCDFLKDQLHTTNCLGFMAFADLHACSDLLTESQRYARKHFPDVRMSEEFTQLPLTTVVDLISSNELGVLSEEDVFEAVLQWVKTDKENRLVHLPELIHHVRYELLTSNYILHHVAEEPLLSESPACKDFIIKALKYRLMPPKERARHETTSRARIGGPQSILVVGGQAPKAIRNTEIIDSKSPLCKVGPDLVSRRCRCGVTVLNGSVFAVGGFDGTSRVRSVEYLDLEKGYWVTVESMLSRRSTLGVAVLNGELYAVGGFDGTNGLDTVERYNPEQKKWVNVGSMSTRRSSVGVAVLNNFLYAVGGYDGGARQCLNSVERYNPASDEWSLVEPMSQRRSGAAVVVLENMLYAIGGHDGPDIRKSVERYDPSSKKWKRIQEMATPRRNAAGTMVHNCIYVVGGDDGITNLSTTEVYDPLKDQWTFQECGLTEGRSYAGVAVLEKSPDMLQFQ